MQYLIAAGIGLGAGIFNLLIMLLMKKKKGLDAFSGECWYKQKVLWIVLIGMPVISIYFLWRTEGLGYEYGVKFALVVYLLILSIYDLKYKLLPDVWHGIYAVVFLMYTFMAGSWYNIINGVIGLVVTLVIFGAAYLLKKDQFGIGDVKTLCVCALLVGLPDIFYVVFRGLLIAAIVGIIRLIGHKAELKTELPFIPFLFLGVLI